jgi:tetratricopeptide (TPR) repeat protein
MKRHKTHLLFYLSALFLLSGCSTSKNTWLTRDYHAFTTYYNIYFNANENFKEGINAINKAQKDNYSQLLPMYAISQHGNATAGKTKMDITIEKCRKCIKLKSIKVKPKRHPSKMKDPAYIAFLNKEEYNPMVLKAWLLLAQAEFHKADFLGAMGTYAYIINHYAADPDVANEALIGKSRCFSEMGWNYEAEDALNKVGTKTSLNKRINGLYAAAAADLFIKEKRYTDAIPFLQTAADNESNRFQKARFYFVLGQLTARFNDQATAYYAFSKAIKASSSSEMELAARLQRAQVAGEKTEKMLAKLHKMAMSPQNKEYADQINVVIGNIYLKGNQKAKAVESYLAAIKSKNPDNVDKMTANIRLGDIYYNDKAYLKAQPCYVAATKQIKPENDDFERVTKRAEVLNELAGYSNTVHLQDSLQQLAGLPEKERLAAIQKYITGLKKTEQEALAQQKALQANVSTTGFGQPGSGNRNANFAVSTNQTLSNAATSWYFYNSNTAQSGISQFQQTWGRRSLEDDWRRTDKTSISNNLQTVAQQVDSAKQGVQKKITDKYDPAFYLAQLPSKPDDFAKSNSLISKSLFNMGQLYEKKLKEDSLAMAAYEELYRRFRVDSAWIEAYYSLYRINEKAGKTAEAEKYKAVIIAHFPSSQYGQLLAHPEYAQHQRAIEQQQDSLYEATFIAYTHNDFQTVINSYKRVNSEYPFASLMPKFALLNALSTGKNGDQQGMKNALEELVKKYPQSDVISTAKDMLALIGQGKTVTRGSMYGTLTSRQQEATATAKQAEKSLPAFTAIRNNRHLVLLPVVSDTININRLVYKIAVYDFGHYVLKDFDLTIKSLSYNQRAIVVSDFSSFEDARYYMASLSEDATLSTNLSANGIKPVAISDDNLKAIVAGQPFDDYLKFYQNTLIPAQAAEEKDNH